MLRLTINGHFQLKMNDFLEILSTNGELTTLKNVLYGSKCLSHRVCSFEPSYAPLAHCIGSGSPKMAIFSTKMSNFQLLIAKMRPWMLSGTSFWVLICHSTKMCPYIARLTKKDDLAGKCGYFTATIRTICCQNAAVKCFWVKSSKLRRVCCAGLSYSLVAQCIGSGSPNTQNVRVKSAV